MTPFLWFCLLTIAPAIVGAYISKSRGLGLLAGGAVGTVLSWLGVLILALYRPK